MTFIATSMKLHKRHLLPRLIRKARQSPCRHKVVAIGLNRRGTIIALTTNQFRFPRTGGGWHAEELLLHRTPRSLAKILIARVRDDRLLPIHPCNKCCRLARKFNVTIEQVVG